MHINLSLNLVKIDFLPLLLIYISYFIANFDRILLFSVKTQPKKDVKYKKNV